MIFYIRTLISFATLIAISNAVEFDCRYDALQWPIVNSQYACYALVGKVRDGDVVTNVCGKHQGSNKNADVRIFFMSDDKIFNRIPRGLETYYSNLVGLKWFNGLLLSVTANDLKPFPNLRVLSLQGNQIFSIDADLFKYSKNLEYINIGYNSLEHVGQDAFGSLSLLKELNILETYCINMRGFSSPDTITNIKQQLPKLCPPRFTDNSVNDTLTSLIPGILAHHELRLDEVERKLRALTVD